MIKMAIDGQKRTGRYHVDCVCGDTWIGEAEQLNQWEWNPAAPIAESVVHLRLQHPEGLLELRFSVDFSDWLKQYWERWGERLRERHRTTADRTPRWQKFR